VYDDEGKTKRSKKMNAFGPGVMRQAHKIVKSVTGLKNLMGVRSTGAGPGRIQKL
jgi:hypothetical protein